MVSESLTTKPDINIKEGCSIPMWYVHTYLLQCGCGSGGSKHILPDQSYLKGVNLSLLPLVLIGDQGDQSHKPPSCA